MRGKLKVLVSALALTLIATVSLTEFVSELLGPKRICGLIGFGSVFLVALYPIAVVAAFLAYTSFGTWRSQRALARKQRGKRACVRNGTEKT